MPDPAEENLADLLFGLIALQKAYLNRNQLALALAAQERYSRSGLRVSLGEACLKDRYLGQEAVAQILRLQHKELRSDREALFGRLSVRNAFAEPADVRRAIAVQEQDGEQRPIGRIMLDLCLITPQQHGAILAAQRRLARSSPAGRETSQEEIRWFASFFIIAEMSRSPMGAVYRAYDPARDEEVALKVLPAEGASPAGIERFRRETAAARRLDHPGIVALRDTGEADGLPYYTMDLIDGPTLEEALPTLPTGVVLAALRDAALALDHAHRQGIVHRDVSPANIVLDGDDRPYVTDFGLSLETGADALETAGTPDTMAPEQVTGSSALDGRTDIYALGAILFRAMTGEPPFAGDTTEELFEAIMHKGPPDLAARRPDLPPALAALCNACLAKNPDDRPPTAIGFAEKLDEILSVNYS